MVIIADIGDPQCRALNLSDGQRCIVQATAYNDLFCKFHAKQCYGLYLGYKRRNRALDALDGEAPEFLKKQGDAPVGNVSFKSIKTTEELHAIHDHLFKQYVLLGKVIAARQLHHKHFFSVDMDYGHVVYLGKLQMRRLAVLRALENVDKRSGAILYEREQWFKWVRTSQSNEEATRDKEQKKVKAEAAMFQRHWKEVQSRIKVHRAEEERKKQDAYLEQAWKKRLEESSFESESEALGDWDPIDDVLEEEREKYLDLIRRFLWMEVNKDESISAHEDNPAILVSVPAPIVEDDLEHVENADPAGTSSNKKKSKSKSKKKKAKKSSPSTTDSPASRTSKPLAIPGREQEEVGKIHIESQDEIRSRLQQGIERDHSGLYGPQLVGTIQKPMETYERLAPLPADEIEKVLGDISDIKILFFCRTLLSHATLLPVALRAKSVDDFLADPKVSDSDLRDLCLKVEDPSLQVLRDACADFARGDDPEPPLPVDEVEVYSAAELMRRNMMYGDLDELDLFASMMSNMAVKSPHSAASIFAANKKEIKASKSTRIKITVCGRTIWNYASEHAMARDGWLQFSIMAKDCHFNEAVELCRNWDEFYELQTLTLWNFFPSAKWASWAQNAMHEQLLSLGFITFHLQLDAEQHTMRNQVGSKGHQRRQHHVEECRNIVCGHMKRGDPVTNRFIDYCLMQGGSLCILVRDRLTGQIVTAPPRDQRWLCRVKSGLGRAAKNEWDNVRELGHAYFDYVDAQREWHFGFESCYDVYVYDFVPGQRPVELFHRLVDTFIRARRITGPQETSAHQKHILEHLVQEQDTKRVRLIRPGEEGGSIWDGLSGVNAQYAVVSSNSQGSKLKMYDKEMTAIEGNSSYLWWNQTDVAESEVLFAGERDQGLFSEIENPVVLVEGGPVTMLERRAERLEHLLESPVLCMDEDDDKYYAGPLTQQKSPFSNYKDYEGAEQFMYCVPQIWRAAYFEINRTAGNHGPARESMLDRLDYFATKLALQGTDLDKLDKLELMERDRAFGMKDCFHLADLEPGAREKYVESTKIIMGAQKHTFTGAVDTDWTWFCLEILDALGLQAWYDDYVQESLVPWPHRYLAQDMTQAFVMMGLFFPKLRTTKVVRDFLDSKHGRLFRDSKIFDQAARAREIPDRRGRDSGLERPRSFYQDVNRVYKGMWVDDYPFAWNLAVKPIIAKLYRAGVIAPSQTPPWVPEACRGLAFAAEEPHRPGKLDMFIKFAASPMLKFPPTYVAKKDWPELLAPAVAFGLLHPQARFAVLRLWSAPHFCPLMIGYWNRPNFTFVDSQSRAWEWKFIPKDMDGAEWSTHMTTMTRLELVFERAEKYARFASNKTRMKGLRTKVVYRGDAILVMGEDEEDLLRSVTAVAFALQTKPWLREVDLWKSFVNVDLTFLQGLDPVWLD